MPNWNHTLKLKDLIKQDAEDHDAHARQIGPKAAERVMRLSKQIARRDINLATDLEEVADGFGHAADADEPQAQFNGALSDLYDLGDRHRIWIA